MSKENGARDFVDPLAGGIAVIESFDDANSAVTLSEIADRTGLSRGTAARMLKTLESLGHVRGALSRQLASGPARRASLRRRAGSA